MIKGKLKAKERGLVTVASFDGTTASIWVDPDQRWYLVSDYGEFYKVKHKVLTLTLRKADYEKLFMEIKS